MDWIELLQNQGPICVTAVVAIGSMAWLTITVVRFFQNHSTHLTNAIRELTGVIQELKEEVIRYR